MIYQNSPDTLSLNARMQSLKQRVTCKTCYLSLYNRFQFDMAIEISQYQPVTDSWLSSQLEIVSLVTPTIFPSDKSTSFCWLMFTQSSVKILKEKQLSCVITTAINYELKVNAYILQSSLWSESTWVGI